MDIQPAYCFLLGRPWIHGAGVVTSTLHQKIKFSSGSNIVIVCAEKKYMVSHLTSFRYIEVEGEVHDTLFQAFEGVQMIKTPRSEGKKHAVSMSLLKDAIAVVENGHPEGWGHVLDPPMKFDKIGLSFGNSKQDITPEAPHTSKVLTPVKFTSAGFISNDQANAISADDDSDYDINNWI